MRAELAERDDHEAPVIGRLPRSSSPWPALGLKPTLCIHPKLRLDARLAKLAVCATTRRPTRKLSCRPDHKHSSRLPPPWHGRVLPGLDSYAGSQTDGWHDVKALFKQLRSVSVNHQLLLWWPCWKTGLLLLGCGVCETSIGQLGVRARSRRSAPSTTQSVTSPVRSLTQAALKYRRQTIPVVAVFLGCGSLVRG